MTPQSRIVTVLGDAMDVRARSVGRDEGKLGIVLGGSADARVSPERYHAEKNPRLRAGGSLG
jgi:hypothetical protein